MKMRSEYGKAQNHHIGLNENKNRVYQLKKIRQYGFFKVM